MWPIPTKARHGEEEAEEAGEEAEEEAEGEIVGPRVSMSTLVVSERYFRSGREESRPV